MTISDPALKRETNELRGDRQTFVSYMLWIESEFQYGYFVENVTRSGTDPDSLHNPPFCYVTGVRRP
jgi:hypothetical protein